MPVELKIDRAVYLADDATRTYRFLKRNPDWKALDPAESDKNKRRINGYTRIFRNGRRKKFQYGESQ